MTFEVYKEEVKRTLPDLGDWKGNGIILNSLHCSVGMFSETYEINDAFASGDKVNLREELTDTAWYLSNYINVRSIVITAVLIDLGNGEIDPSKIEDFHGRLINIMSELQDYDKKEFAYGKVETEEIKNRRVVLANEAIYTLNLMFYHCGCNPEEGMEQNINKLRARYPEKFDADKAINRDTDAERTHLGN